MLDIKFIREHPDEIKQNIKKKFQEDRIPLVDKLLKADEQHRKLMQESQELRHKRNMMSEEINKLKKEGKPADKQLKEVKAIPDRIAKIEQEQAELANTIHECLFLIPNMIHSSVPIGKDETKNVEIKKIGKVKKFAFEVVNHAELCENLRIADFEAAARTSGKGFYFLTGLLAQLDMALINYARDYMIKQGYLYVEPPWMIKQHILTGVYSSREIAAMSYKIEGEDLFLIATSEHPLIGMYVDAVIHKKNLPVKLTAFSPCFRKEVGSHGLDEKGLFRTHQFNKQEMVVICHPDDSYKYYDEMLNHTINIFKGLGIPIRVLESCSGDLGDLKAKGCDVEAWSPRQKKYFEVCSLTNMEAAQARRLNIKVQDGNEKYFAHTLNNTVIATSRAMVAILENFQNKDGSVDIPEVLWQYMHGIKKITKQE